MFKPLSPKARSMTHDYEIGQDSLSPHNGNIRSRYAAHNSAPVAANENDVLHYNQGPFDAHAFDDVRYGHAHDFNDDGDDDSGDSDYGSNESIKRDLSARHINMIALAGMIVCLAIPSRAVTWERRWRFIQLIALFSRVLVSSSLPASQSLAPVQLGHLLHTLSWALSQLAWPIRPANIALSCRTRVVLSDMRPNISSRLWVLLLDGTFVCNSARSGYGIITGLSANGVRRVHHVDYCAYRH